MDFVYPQYLRLLLGVPVVMLLWAVGIWHHQRMRGRFGDMANLHEISRVSWSGRGWMRGGMFAVSLTAMILGLAYPQMPGREVRPVPQPTDVVFMLDISPSMFARDMDPTRLGRAQQIVQEFLVNKLPEDRYALVGFNYNSIILSYLTRDPQGVVVYFDYLNGTTEPGLGTNMGSAMTAALRVVDADDRMQPQNKQRRRIFVLMSDGDDLLDQWQQPLNELSARDIRLYSFGLGSANGAPFPIYLTPDGDIDLYATDYAGGRLISKAQARTLREIADRSGGRFYRGEDNRQVELAIDQILTSGRPIAGYQSYPVRRDLYLYFFGAAFFCMLAGIVL